MKTLSDNELVKAVKGGDTREMLSPEKSLRNYLLVLSRNAVLDGLRSKQYLLRKDTPEAPLEISSSEQSNYRAEYTETYSSIMKIVSAMPPQRQAVFKMSRFPTE